MMNVTNDRLKQCELAMLQAFISICDHLNLKYYLVEGTLLGAVRHRGFIPWDDDIDVAMPRCDYERFLHEAQALLPSYYFVQSSYSEPEYHANFAKIRDCRTTFVESSVRERPINHGVYIDIFPLDFVPKSQFLNQCVKIVDRFCMLRIARVFTLPAKKRNIIEKAVWVGARAFSNVCFPTLRHAIKTQRRLYIACKKGSIVTNYGSAWKEKERMPVEWYGEGTVLTFEGISVRVPVEYDKWLKQVYGDYMTPPPPEQQAGHHYTEFIDLERPYTEYIQQKKHKN